MGKAEIEVVFDRPSSTYFSGDSVTGQVVLSVERAEKIKGIQIDSKGESWVYWDIGNGVNDFFGRETYFEKKTTLVGPHDDSRQHGDIGVLEGENVFPFAVDLPPTTPSSFEGALGYVRYTLRVRVLRAWKLPLEYRCSFRVICPLDLNEHPTARDPVHLSTEKTFCCLWCRAGPLALAVSLPVGGFTSGQRIPVTVEVDNGTDRPVTGVTCKLRKTASFHARSPVPTSRQVNQTLDELSFDGVPKRGSAAWTRGLTMPVLPPSILAGCSLIDIEYLLRVEAHVAGLGTVELDAPFVFGTTPLVNTPLVNGTTPLVNGTTPLVNTTTPLVNGISPLVKEAIPSVNGPMPLVKEAMPSVNDSVGESLG